MTEDVLTVIRGSRPDMEEDDAGEVITPAKYYFRGGKHYVVYDRYDEDADTEHTTLKITENQVDVIKHGSGRVHMIFSNGEKTMCRYGTPIGDLLIEIDTNLMEYSLEEDARTLRIGYILTMNSVEIGQCYVDIQVSSKGKARLFNDKQEGDRDE